MPGAKLDLMKFLIKLSISLSLFLFFYLFFPKSVQADWCNSTSANKPTYSTANNQVVITINDRNVQDGQPYTITNRNRDLTTATANGTTVTFLIDPVYIDPASGTKHEAFDQNFAGIELFTITNVTPTATGETPQDNCTFMKRVPNEVSQNINDYITNEHPDLISPSTAAGTGTTAPAVAPVGTTAPPAAPAGTGTTDPPSVPGTQTTVQATNNSSDNVAEIILEQLTNPEPDDFATYDQLTLARLNELLHDTYQFDRTYNNNSLAQLDIPHPLFLQYYDLSQNGDITNLTQAIEFFENQGLDFDYVHYALERVYAVNNIYDTYAQSGQLTPTSIAAYTTAINSLLSGYSSGGGASAIQAAIASLSSSGTFTTSGSAGIPDCSLGINTALGFIYTEPVCLVKWVLKYGILMGSGLAFLLSLWGGLTIIFSSGNPEKTNEGKQLITSAVTGLLFIIFSVFLLRLIGLNIFQIPDFI